MDVCDSSNLNRFKEHEAIVVAFAHGQRDSSNTMQLVDVFETLGEVECIGADVVIPIKTANALISRLKTFFLGGGMEYQS